MTTQLCPARTLMVPSMELLVVVMTVTLREVRRCLRARPLSTRRRPLSGLSSVRCRRLPLPWQQRIQTPHRLPEPRTSWWWCPPTRARLGSIALAALSCPPSPFPPVLSCVR